MNRSDAAARWALLFGNFVIGTGVLAPAGLINQLASAFVIDVVTVSTLIAYGAVVLCIEAPLLAFLTNKIDRRLLLTASLALYAVGHFASALAPSFALLLAARLVMVGAAAVFTPQAASALGLFIAPERRASAVAFIFMGWSLANAVGIPLVSLVGGHVGWSSVYLMLALACAAAAVAVYITVPGGLQSPKLSVAAWKEVLANRKILLLLTVTCIFIAGQFTVYPFMAASLKTSLNAGPSLIAALFAIYGLAGVAGTAASSAVIGRFGAPVTVSACLAVVIVGLAMWSGHASSFALAVAGLLVWGSGGAPAISGQQARLIAADPMVASASVALNTSVLYAGQAVGTSLGGEILTRGHESMTGVVGIALLSAAMLASLLASSRYRA
jgi:MFS transporter, DHA1 family, inner membrane transport protein